MKVFLSIVTLLIVAPLLIFGLYYLAYQTDVGIVDEDKVVIEKLQDALASSISKKAVKVFSDEWSYICSPIHLVSVIGSSQNCRLWSV